MAALLCLSCILVSPSSSFPNASLEFNAVSSRIVRTHVFHRNEMPCFLVAFGCLSLLGQLAHFPMTQPFTCDMSAARAAFPSTGILLAVGDAVDGDGEGVLEHLLLFLGGVLLRPQPFQNLGLQDVQRVDVRVPDLKGAEQNLVVLLRYGEVPEL
eukprot:FR737740.1.p1 GENE.FR737740.1~~FR737740.1.p1  ORF type:complete len:155 (-),score=5.11 FR737740.1:14-478(-)